MSILAEGLRGKKKKKKIKDVKYSWCWPNSEAAGSDDKV